MQQIQHRSVRLIEQEHVPVVAKCLPCSGERRRPLRPMKRCRHGDDHEIGGLPITETGCVHCVAKYVRGNVGGAAESLRGARIGVAQAHLILGFGKREAMLRIALAACESFGRVANQGLVIDHCNHRRHGNLAAGLAWFIHGLARAVDLTVFKAGQSDATLGGSQVNADRGTFIRLLCKHIAQLVKHGCCPHLRSPPRMSRFGRSLALRDLTRCDGRRGNDDQVPLVQSGLKGEYAMPRVRSWFDRLVLSTVEGLTTNGGGESRAWLPSTSLS
jgi:hypothetical protein